MGFRGGAVPFKGPQRGVRVGVKGILADQALDFS